MNRLFAFALAAGCAGLALVQPVQIHAAPLTIAPDTISPQHFQVPAQPLVDALREIGRQARVAVEIKAHIAPNLQAPALVGTYTLPDALRHILFGTDLQAEFSDNGFVVVLDKDIPIYNLRALEVVGMRNRGYSAVRTATATKTDIPLRDAPQSISVITRDVISDMAMQSMTDVMRLIPGVTMGQGEGHRDAPTIRGNSTTADFFVDGVRDDAQYYRDVYNLERVEALKGANALVFGRGGGGGVVNRVTKEPSWSEDARMTLQTGSYNHRRGMLDVNQPLNDQVAVRLNGVYENSDGFRDEASLERFGINPTVALALGPRTWVRAGYEFFDDDRTVDRGIPSFRGGPSPADRTTFFGNPDSSYASARVQTATAVVEHKVAGVTLRNRMRYTDYDKFYQNSFPSALNAEGTQVTLSAYNNATDRQNLFNQTDVIVEANTGAVQHTLVTGIELGRQTTENFRETGYYNDAATSFTADFTDPTISAPITFRQSPTDADNRAVVNVSSAYVQDQIALTTHWQAILGLRYDRFNIDFHNRRNDTELTRLDEFVSPRMGLLYKPLETASFYGSYSVSHLPSSGDQFSSLTATTQTLEPEKFTNYEVGAKWDVRANLSITFAAYRLDRTNTTAPDPLDPTRVVQTGSQRTEGLEAGVAGDITRNWHVVAAAAWQKAEITSRTSAAEEGARVALVPERTFSLWNRYSVVSGFDVGLGVIHQADMYAAIDNSVTLPGFTRADGALFVKLGSKVSAQVNVENLFDKLYFSTSHGNNNIMPGTGRTLRLSLTTRR